VFTIEDAKRVQIDLGLGDRHVVYFDLAEGFVMAHTNAERTAGVDLMECHVHYWLTMLGDDPVGWGPYVGSGVLVRQPGWYTMAYPTQAKGLAL
jgi:hypothetical protein